MTIESSRQVEQAVGIRRCGTNLDGRSLTVKQMEVETLAAEIQTGVQHCNGPPLDSSQSTRWSVSLGRPFFMAFLTRRRQLHQFIGSSAPVLLLCLSSRQRRLLVRVAAHSQFGNVTRANGRLS